MSDSSLSNITLDALRKITATHTKLSPRIIKPSSFGKRSAAVRGFIAQGRHVARVVSGDPLFFSSRMQKELAEYRGFQCDIVPGLTSAIAATTIAGIVCNRQSNPEYSRFPRMWKLSKAMQALFQGFVLP